MIISGAEDGSLAVSSPATGMTVRMLKDHRGAPITDIHVSSHKVSQSGTDAVGYSVLLNAKPFNIVKDV